MMLGLLLARAGVRVIVLEKHADFLRDFRGDTLHPSTLEIMHELGVLDRFLRLPHQKVPRINGRFGEVEFTVADPRRLAAAVTAVKGCGEGEPVVDKDKAEVTVRAGRNGSAVLLDVVRQLDAKKIKVFGLGVRRPSLDDVFLALTGHRAEESETEGKEAVGE